MTHSSTDELYEIAWTPDLFGVVYKKESITLREVLTAHRHDKWTKMMATFVPDQLIYGMNISRNSPMKFNVVLSLIDISSMFALHEKFANGQNGGSVALVATLNNFMDIIMEEVYTCGGDILKFSTEALLVAWRVRKTEDNFNMTHKAIICGQRIQNEVSLLPVVETIPNVNIAISAGEVIFCVIGDTSSKTILLAGSPIIDLKNTRRSFLTNDLVLSSRAWEHCRPSQYEYVIKDSNNIRVKLYAKLYEIKANESGGQSKTEITKVLASSLGDSDIFESIDNYFAESEFGRSPFMETESIDQQPIPADLISIDGETVTRKAMTSRMSVDMAAEWELSEELKSFIPKPVLQQIERNQQLLYLTESRKVTSLSIDVIPNKCPEYDLISLADRVYRLLLSVIAKCGGYVITTNLYDRTLLFVVVFGLKGYQRECDGVDHNTAKCALHCAAKVHETMQTMAGIKAVCMGISTGLAFCAVIGHEARRQYCVIGSSVDKSIAMTQISYNMISADFDTLQRSTISIRDFQYRGLKLLKKYGKCHVYEYIPISVRTEGTEAISYLDYCYPILDRFEDMEYFKDILDDIGLPERGYAGILIQGKKRSGKSRLLDALVSIAVGRQIKALQLPLYSFYEDETYSVIYLLFMQLLEADNSKTMEDRERILSQKLSNILNSDEFCYLNSMMKVQFPFSESYFADNDLKRHMKTLKIVESILASPMVGRLCIFLDDVQHLDFMSWQYISASLNNHNIVLVMTVSEPESLDALSHVENDIFKDKRLLVRFMRNLSLEYVTPFACQFLNVMAIPRSLEKLLLKYSNGNIAWCEIFLISCLQSLGLSILNVSAKNASQYDLVFPEGCLVRKIPVFLTPEDVAPPPHWTRMTSLSICVTNEKFVAFVEARNELKTIQLNVFKRMSEYQQILFKTATTLAPLFHRSTLQSIMPNHTPLHTAKAVAELIRIRLLQCGMVQRKEFDTGDQTFCLEQKRTTFSDMHYLLICECRPSYISTGRALPIYAHCKFLEFRVPSYGQLVNETLTVIEREEYHGKASQIFEQQARRCSACGGTNFLRSPFTDHVEQETSPSILRPVAFDRRSTMMEILDKSDKPLNISPNANNSYRPRSGSRQSNIHMSSQLLARRVSAMAEFIDVENTSIANTAAFIASIPGPSFRDRYYSMDPSITGVPPKFDQDNSDICYANFECSIREFRHIDYRNCQCTTVINCHFRNIYHHMRFSGDSMKIVRFLLEYSAGLIRIGQPLLAIKLLHVATQKAEECGMRGIRSITNQERSSIQGVILVLMGDGHMSLGNYLQAKKFYSQAVALRSGLFRSQRNICYNVIVESIRKKWTGFADYSMHKVSGEAAIPKLELASYLRRLAIVLLMTYGRHKLLKLVILKSIRVAFECQDGLLEKSDLYLTAIQIFKFFGDTASILQLEKHLLSIVHKKNLWRDPDEMVKLAQVLLIMYKFRAMQGELDIALDIGSKVLRMSTEFRLSRIKLTILPSFIEIMIWTKHINEAIDLMSDLYASSSEDTDYSALTWYYALCLEFLLDAGIVTKSYDECFRHYKQMIKNKSGVSRDSESLHRLMTCVTLWQLRIPSTVNATAVRLLDSYAKHSACDTFSSMVGCVKVLEAFLMILLHRANYKQSSDLIHRVEQVENMMARLEVASANGAFIKPYLYLMISYAEVQRRRKAASDIAIQKSHKWASLQGNKLMIAWIIQNKRTWKELKYNNMADYWVEHVAESNAVHWQDINKLDLESWASILYPLPIADLSF